jgi:1A family penicillin-binding protein
MFKKIKNIKFNKKNILKISKYLLYAFLICCAGIILLIFYYIWDLPQPEKFTETPFIQSTKIYDRTGKVLLYDVYGEEKREVVSFDKISENLKHAVLASEDSRFYQHGGVDVLRTLKAIFIDIKSQSKSQGGSTITQQLIKSVYLTGQKSISRKVREIILSIELEARYSKDQIFDWYLNQVPFGENAYGAEAAAQTYFNKPALDLTAAESALLTAILPSTSYYSPYGSHKEELFAKKDIILERMYKLGYISEQELENAKNEKLTFAESTISIKAPDFVMYVKKYLEDKYGDDYLKEKGLRVYTTLDYDLQEYAEKVIKDSDQSLIAKNAYNAALVAVNPKNGQILALIGSKDYFADPYPKGCDEQGPNKCLFAPKYDVATIGERQPGSAFKPFVYATAFEKGYTPDTVVWDAKTEFNPNCNPNGDDSGPTCYNPQNYDGTYRGKVSLRKALAGSLNIPSVKTLYLAGIDDSIRTAESMGISTLINKNNYGLSLVLGGGEVNLLEMTSAYGVFATEGNYTKPVSILKIEDNEGNIIEENKEQPRKVLDTQVCRLINNVLSDNNARTYMFGPNSILYIPGYDVAVKTGTTQNYKDAWTVGYAPSISVGVWIGNNNNVETRDSGVGSAAPIWNKVIQKVLEQSPVESFSLPNVVTENKDALFGKLPADDINSILYYVDVDNPTGPAPENPAEDPQYILWQIGINNWLIQHQSVLQ